VLALFFEPLFRDVSMLSFDNRFLVPWIANVSAADRPAPMNFITSDINGWIMPDTFVAIEQLRRGEAPLWNPYQYLGQPLLANLAFPVYYVALPIVLVLGPIRAYAVNLALHLLLFGCGSVWFLVRRGLRTRAAVFGALAAILSGFITTHVHLPMVVHVAAYFPWLLLAVEWLVERRTWRAAAVLALVIGLSLLAGFPQVALIQIAAAVAYAFFHAWRCGSETWRLVGALQLVAALLCGAALSAIHLLPAAELLEHSLRREGLSRERLRAKALEPELLAGLVLPHLFADPAVEVDLQNRAPPQLEPLPTAAAWLEHDEQMHFDVQNNFVENTVYAGLLVLPLALLGLRRRTHAWFFGGAVAFAWLVALGAPGLLDLARLVPGFTAGSPKRVLVLASVALAYLAAYGLDTVLDPGTRSWRAPFLIAGGAWLAVALAAWFGLPPLFAEADRVRAALAGDVIALLGAGLVLIGSASWLAGRPEHVANLVIAATLLDLGLFLRRTNPWQPLRGQYDPTAAIEFLRANTEPQGYRMCRIGGPFHLPATIASIYGLASVDGTASMVVARVGELLAAIDPTVLDPLDPRVASGFANADIVAKPIFDALAVRYALKSVEPLPARDDLVLAYAGEAEGLGIYARPHPQPHVFLAREVKTIADRERRLSALADPHFDCETAIVEEDVTALGRVLGRGTSEFARPRAAELDIGVSIDGAGLLVVSETAMPGWNAEVDGIWTRVLTVDHALMGIPVPRGEHKVRLVYDPASFRVGAACSLLALLAITAALIVPRRGRRAPESAPTA
jgi:hypothetical protein